VAIVYLGLGSNLGDRLANLHFGLHCLETPCLIEAVSSLYETEPMGPPQPPFYNAVCEVETLLEPLQLLSFLKAVESEAGRKDGGKRWGPRTLDIDILLYDDQIIQTEELTVPHPRLQERAFVLAPLCGIAPDLRHPENDKTMQELLATVETTGVRQIAGSDWFEIESSA
jgi:2-amino-4-hydroxy-6-hydroxymethyldihydropteridine diphosphokinase